VLFKTAIMNWSR